MNVNFSDICIWSVGTNATFIIQWKSFTSRSQTFEKNSQLDKRWHNWLVVHFNGSACQDMNIRFSSHHPQHPPPPLNYVHHWICAIRIFMRIKTQTSTIFWSFSYGWKRWENKRFKSICINCNVAKRQRYKTQGIEKGKSNEKENIAIVVVIDKVVAATKDLETA